MSGVILAGMLIGNTSWPCTPYQPIEEGLHGGTGTPEDSGYARALHCESSLMSRAVSIVMPEHGDVGHYATHEARCKSPHVLQVLETVYIPLLEQHIQAPPKGKENIVQPFTRVLGSCRSFLSAYKHAEQLGQGTEDVL